MGKKSVVIVIFALAVVVGVVGWGYLPPRVNQLPVLPMKAKVTNSKPSLETSLHLDSPDKVLASIDNPENKLERALAQPSPSVSSTPVVALPKVLSRLGISRKDKHSLILKYTVKEPSIESQAAQSAGADGDQSNLAP